MTATPAPALTDAEQQVVDRFGIFEPEEREAAVVESVALAILRSDYPEAKAVDDEIPEWQRLYRSRAAAAVAAYRATQDGGAEVARLSPDGVLVAIRRGANDWRVSNGGHYRDLHVADWTPLTLQADR